MSDQIDPDQIPEPVDVRDNRESRAAAEQVPSSVARAADGGPTPKQAPAPGEAPERAEGGVADGNPVAGVEIDPEDAAEAVPGDTGPDELGGRGPAPSRTR